MLPANRRFIINVAANALTGGSSALFALVLPYVFVRHLSSAQFSAWVLTVQLAGYVNYLNFGLQTAVGRYVAHALARDDRDQARKMLGTSVQILTVLALVAGALIVTLAAAFPYLFKGIAPALVDEARLALLCIGAATSISFPFSAFMGFFIGVQRNDVPAAISVIGNILTATLVAIAVVYTRNIAIAGMIYLAASVAICGVEFFQFRRSAPWCRVSLRGFSPVAWRELLGYSASLAGWSFAMFLVTGLDTSIVGVFNFREVAAYGVSASAVLILLGLVRAVLGPTIQIFARLHARNEIARLSELLNLSSDAFAVFLIVTGAWLVVVGHLAFSFWIGARLSGAALPIFYVLVVANVMRNTAAPYANYLVGTAQQQRTLLAPLLEGVSNLVASILLAYRFGAIGVAFGTLIGAIIGVAANSLYTIPRTAPAGFDAVQFLRTAIGIPILVCAPLIAIATYVILSAPGALWSAVLLALGTAWPAVRFVRAWRTTESRWRISSDTIGDAVTG